jgi:hypothetical protein
MRILGYEFGGGNAGLKANTAPEQHIHINDTQNKTVSMRTMEMIRGFGGLIRGLGQMFRGNRDIYEVYGYKKQIGFMDCISRYWRQDIAGRIINMPADAIWTKPPTLKGDEKVVAVIQDLIQRFSLWQVLNRADKLAGMGQYSVVLIGLDDGLSLDKPVNANRTNKVIFLQPMSSVSCTVTQYETNALSPRFGLPLYYSLNLQRGGLGSFAGSGVQPTGLQTSAVIGGKVHWSRLVHIAENTLEDPIFGFPRMQRVYNLLDDFLKTGGGSAEIYWLNARGGLHIDVDKEMDLDGTDADALEAEIDDYSNNLRRVIRTRGVKVEPINMQMGDPRAVFEVTLNLICASEGIPQRLLLGTEAGQLASEQDRANWAVRINERRTTFAEPNCIRPLIIALATMGFFDLKAGLSLTVSWPEAFTLNPLERGQTSAQQARAAANLTKAIGTPDTPATPDTTDPVTGAVIPGQPMVPGTPGLVTIDEAHSIIMAAAPQTDKTLE